MIIIKSDIRKNLFRVLLMLTPPLAIGLEGAAQSSVWFTSTLQISSINQTFLDFTWTTNIASSTAIRYGTTPSLELGTLNAGGSVVNHGISLTGLSAATIYYVKAFSVAGTDTAFSPVKIVCTASGSSGEIRVYFNHPVDNNASTVTDAIYTPAFEDTIITYIDKIQSTLDIALYNNTRAATITAINNAYSRGVIVRYVADKTTSNSALNNLNPAINVLKGNSSGIMHNKFAVIDRSSPNGAWVITGSVNWTYQSFFDDFNNLVIIQDQSLARAYTLEFEEMWGGIGFSPDSLNSKFGTAKSDNTPHEFRIGGKNVQLYFSPSDNATGTILKALNSAGSDISFALLTLTRKDIADSLISARNRGCLSRGAIEQINDVGSEYNYLLSNGIDVRSHLDSAGLLHHKYGIIDANLSSSDPTVITGSHNWTFSAEDVNDENMLVIHDNIIANMFLEEFEKRFNELPMGIPEIKYQSSKFKIQKGKIIIYDVLGRIAAILPVNSIYAADPSFLIHRNNFPAGIYFYKISSDSGISGSGKLVVE
ncbi:MAG: T9SS type A sorting domain-containing protein [Bacteroidetes bacterium]|nr:T9SS type A sorting domain-containing protein [Bacteroidota bacterium]